MDKRKKQILDRKQRIVHAAIECFVRSGVAGVRFKEVAEKAGVDQPLIHYYFPNIDSLLVDVVHVVLESLKTATLEGIELSPHPEKILANYIRVPFQWAEKNSGYFTIWMYFYHLASFHPTFMELNKSIRENGRNRISVILYNGLEKGVFAMPKGISVNLMAAQIQGLITGNTIMAETEDRSKLKIFADETVQFILTAVKTSKK